MLRSTLNLGILAHVDAGKTTLSERLLYAAGVIDQVGRVDDGTTQTDSLALERQRGITIRAAIVALDIAGTAVNLIDTPGHPDFIAEVDRVLGVLDGAVLVVSAVEGVQPQTRVLMRALRRLHVPTLVFVNKVDRRGADVDRVLDQLERRLGVPILSMSRVSRSGDAEAAVTPLTGADFREPAVDALSVNDDALLADYVEAPQALTPARLTAALRAQTCTGQVCPVFAGSALTGTGVPALMMGLVELLPVTTGDDDGELSGLVFKIERGSGGEKVVSARIFGGTLRTRDRPAHPDDPVGAVRVFIDGAWVRRDAVGAGEIGRLWGLTHARIGDPLGRPPAGARSQFAVPALEAVVEPVRAEDHVALRAALQELAEQDPLIAVRDAAGQLAVSLYGEVQKEVIGATLAADYGLEVMFRGATPLYVERPRGSGEALERLNTPANPFQATLGFRVQPGRAGSGIVLRARVDHRTIPLYVYKTMGGFVAALEEYVRNTLREGLSGWPVEDVVVTLTTCNYSVADGPPSQRGPTSTAADFRKLTPLVLMAALQRAGAAVCEPMAGVRLDAPGATLGPLLAGLARLGTTVQTQHTQGDDVVLEVLLPAADVAELHRLLPGLTHGEGILESHPAGYRRVRGRPPFRRRTTVDPRHRQEYLAALRL